MDVLNYCWEDTVVGADADVVKRWQDELTNRRQYMFNIQSLQEDVFMARDKIEGARGDFSREMTDLKLLVGSRTSVAKEQVYPKFDVLATLYMALRDERNNVAARLRILETLRDLAGGYTPTLHEEWVEAARRAAREKKMRARESAEADGGVFGGDGAGGKSAEDGAESGSGGGSVNASEGKVGDESKEGGSSGGGEGKEGDGGDGGDGGAAAAAAVTPGESTSGDELPVRLSIETTPEFMQLPLEFQGYCPHTIVSRNALLLPGNPALGVVRYKNTFNVFVSTDAMDEFMRDPSRFITGVIDVARKNPELIHLLRLQNHFPAASLSTLVQNNRLYQAGGGGGGAGNDGIHPLLGVPTPKMVDAATETPLHFVEKNIDPNYDWNEWGLRRRALQIANLRKCATDGTQTDMSAFRRENESQVYLPRENNTQTRSDRGTNPTRVHTYLAGLRNGGSTDYATKYADAGDGSGARTKKKTTVVNLTFEL